MLPKSRRLSKKQVEHVLKMGGRCSSKYFLATVAKVERVEEGVIKNVQNKAQNNGFAVVVSKKVAQKAVDRNKIRRRAYNAIKDVLLDIKILPNRANNVVIMVKREAKEAEFALLKEDVVKILKTAGIL